MTQQQRADSAKFQGVMTEARTLKRLRQYAHAFAKKHGHTLAPFPPSRHCGEHMRSHCVECGASIRLSCRTASTEHHEELEKPCVKGSIFGSPSIHAKTRSGNFGENTYHGDTIHCYPASNLRAVAKIERDDNTESPVERQDGYFPSRKPNDAGYMGKVSETTFRRHMKRAQDWLDAWKNDKWWYGGVVVSIYDKTTGEKLTEDYEHAVWGVDINHPNSPGNEYAVEVANELLADALATVAKRA